MNNQEIDMIYHICVAASEKALITAGLKKATISYPEAKDRCGEYRLRKWMQSGMITPFRQGSAKNSKIYYSLEDIIKAELYDDSKNKSKSKKIINGQN